MLKQDAAARSNHPSWGARPATCRCSETTRAQLPSASGVALRYATTAPPAKPPVPGTIYGPPASLLPEVRRHLSLDEP